MGKTGIQSIFAALGLGAISITAADACANSNMVPGMSIVDTPIQLKPGNGCNVTMDLEGWQIHRITVVEKPRLGSLEMKGSRGYIYRAASKVGNDRFVVEFETTAVDWYSGLSQQRTVWRVTRPVEIR